MNPNEIQRIVLIDDHPLFRKGLRDLAESEPGLQVVGETDNGTDGLRLVRELSPDLVLLDLNMPSMDGLQVLKTLKESDSDAVVIMLTVSDAEEDVVSALRSGADGYLLKDMEPEELLVKLHQAVEGRVVLSPKLAELLALSLRGEAKPTTTEEAGLTEREKEILDLIAAGKPNKAIARELNIADATVKVHVKHLLKKLKLKSRVEAAVWAVENRYKG
jgi:two-component system nitrate/nitrite response regulator NarL